MRMIGYILTSGKFSRRNHERSCLILYHIAPLSSKWNRLCKTDFPARFVLFYYNTNLYNIVDQIFIANASYLGSYGNALAGEEATDYLYEMGHRRIAYFGVSNAMLFSAERRRGYQMSLLKHGITPRESCCPPEV